MSLGELGCQRDSEAKLRENRGANPSHMEGNEGFDTKMTNRLICHSYL